MKNKNKVSVQLLLTSCGLFVASVPFLEAAFHDGAIGILLMGLSLISFMLFFYKD